MASPPDLSTPKAAARHLYGAIQDILDAGYSVTGIDPSKVAIRREPPSHTPTTSSTGSPTAPSMHGAAATTKTAPSVATSPVLSGWSGDTCAKCGGMVQQAGTCGRCLECGESTGCS